MNLHLPKPKWPVAVAVLLLLAAIGGRPALAHRVNIFAWVEGDTVYTESKFSGGRLAVGAPVEVFDDQGNRLLQGKTDDRGGFAFPVPKRSALKIVLHAGTGHQNEWTVPLSEIEAAMASAAPAAGPAKTAGDEAAAPKTPGDGHSAARTDSQSTEAGLGPIPQPSPAAGEVQAAVEKALDRKLKPLILRLNRMEEAQTRPTWRDVLGGIGYILGLMGVAAWVRFRKPTP